MVTDKKLIRRRESLDALWAYMKPLTHAHMHLDTLWIRFLFTLRDGALGSWIIHI